MNILVVTLSNFGDVIMTTQVIMALRRKFPHARITAVVGPRAQSVLQRSPDIYRIVIYDKEAHLWEKIKFIKDLRKVKYDRVVDLRNTLIPFLVSCKKRTPLFRKFTKRSMRERHMELLEMLDEEMPFFPAQEGAELLTTTFRFFNEVDEVFTLSALDQNKIHERSGWIVVAPGASNERKRWPAQYFSEVIRQLNKQTGKRVLLIGNLSERLVAESIAAELPGITSVFCGDMMLPQTASLISQAALLISNDSASMHLGFELGTPTVGIFGPTDHERYGYMGPKFRIAREDASKCSCRSDELPSAERSCFHGLKPEKVIELSLELLNAPKAA